jgi:hypothetical protein
MNGKSVTIIRAKIRSDSVAIVATQTSTQPSCKSDHASACSAVRFKQVKSAFGPDNNRRLPVSGSGYVICSSTCL